MRGERGMTGDGEVTHHSSSQGDAQAGEESVCHEWRGQRAHPIRIEGESGFGILRFPPARGRRRQCHRAHPRLE